VLIRILLDSGGGGTPERKKLLVYRRGRCYFEFKNKLRKGILEKGGRSRGCEGGERRDRRV